MDDLFFENNFVTYAWENGVLIITFKKIKGTLQAAEEIVSDRLCFAGDKPVPVLADIRAVRGADKKALDYFDSEASMKGIAATAIVVESFISRFLANTFLRLYAYKKKVPTHIFNNKKEAMEWLKKYI